MTGHLPFLALSLASLVLATLFTTSLKFPHAITHNVGFTIERRSPTAGLTSCLVSIRKFACVNNAFLHALHQCLAPDVLNGSQLHKDGKGNRY